MIQDKISFQGCQKVLIGNEQFVRDTSSQCEAAFTIKVSQPFHLVLDHQLTHQIVEQFDLDLGIQRVAQNNVADPLDSRMHAVLRQQGFKKIPFVRDYAVQAS